MIAAILLNLRNTVIAGLVLCFIVFLIYVSETEFNNYVFWPFLTRWLHIVSGVMWIGMLWYFNFVQTPTMPKIEPAEHRAAITKFIAPAALFWFRYGALATVLTGLAVAQMQGYLVQALTFQKGVYGIGLGMWLALIMALNVWFIIWPNQKKVLGLVSATPEEKAAAAKLAGMTSRINTMLSIPMLYCMVAQQNGGL